VGVHAYSCQYAAVSSFPGLGPIWPDSLAISPSSSSNDARCWNQPSLDLDVQGVVLHHTCQYGPVLKKTAILPTTCINILRSSRPRRHTTGFNQICQHIPEMFNLFANHQSKSFSPEEIVEDVASHLMSVKMKSSSPHLQMVSYLSDRIPLGTDLYTISPWCIMTVWRRFKLAGNIVAQPYCSSSRTLSLD